MSARHETEGLPLSPPLDFLRRLWRLNHALETLSRRMERRIGVTAQQRLIVRCVGTFPGMSAGQLARLLHLDPGTISAALRRLEAKRLVARRADPLDGRRVTLALTPRGRALDAPEKGTAEEAVAELLESIPAAQARLVGVVLDGLSDRARRQEHLKPVTSHREGATPSLVRAAETMAATASSRSVRSTLTA